MRPFRWCLAAVAATVVAACADVPADVPVAVDADAGTRALRKLPAPPGERVAVSIYEFRSAVTELSARGTTDMFMTALLQSGQFKVIERARINDGVIREKQMNGAGLTNGKTAATLLSSPAYIFEGAITEANTGETQRSGGVSIAGMEVGGGRNRDVIGIDVRVVDAATGEVLDVVTVRKPIVGDSASISGVGNLVATAMARKGHDTTYVPDAQFQQQRKQSLDVALRAAIDQAVIVLAGRFAK